MSRHVWQDADSYSLTALLYQVLGPSHILRQHLKGAHGALVDCESVRLLLLKILEAKPEIRTWSALYEFSQLCRRPLVIPFGRCRGQKITEIEDGLIDWCLRQDWIDEYLRAALEAEVERRYGEVA